MSGYLTGSGYVGWVTNRWMLFSTEAEYSEYLYENNI